jgi:hypothetical protein
MADLSVAPALFETIFFFFSSEKFKFSFVGLIIPEFLTTIKVASVSVVIF